MLAQSRNLVEQGEYTHARDLLRQALLIDSAIAQGERCWKK